MAKPPAEPRALVGNAADEEQVTQAASKEKRRRTRELDDLRAVLALPEGRRVCWRLLEHCGPFRSVLGATDAHTNNNAGRQDVGHFLLAEITTANDEALLTMMREAKETTNA